MHSIVEFAKSKPQLSNYTVQELLSKGVLWESLLLTGDGGIPLCMYLRVASGIPCYLEGMVGFPCACT